MKNEIRMIPIGDLAHHPENPRKDLGDLTELADSIRENGVMQNLTVVADVKMAKYLVVIGNRRMEAAKIAGLPDLPCVISDMDHRTQIATMLMENMQRQDLTVYEQAQGFQMMMDLGFTPKEIGEKTGFSETTVNRRLKMAELDQPTFQKAVGKQITIDDLDRLGKIESVKQRNALLQKYGENNFDWELNRALKVQKASKMKTKAHQMLQEAKIEKIPDKDKYSGKYRRLYDMTCELDKWDGKKNFIPKKDGKLFYSEDATDIDFYLKETRAKSERIEKTEEEKAEDRARELAWKTLERASKAAYELRKQFAEELKVTPTNAMEMMQWALAAAICMVFSYDTPTNALREQIPIEGYDINGVLEQVHKWLFALPQSKWPELILLMFSGDNGSKTPEKYGYVDGYQREFPKWKKNRKLDYCYQWLKAFGYQMSDEEEQLQAGTHPAFQVKV